MRLFPLSAFRRWSGRVVERVFNRGNRTLQFQIDHLAEQIPRVSHDYHAAVADIRRQIDASERDVSEALRRLAKELEQLQARQPLNLVDARLEIYGTPPTLRRIPGWNTYWGIEGSSDPFLATRLHDWSSLNRPILMRWFADLLIMIWPGNELSRVLFVTGNFEPNELVWVSQILSQGMTVIDVGAHMGMYSVIASKLVGESGVVVALEPSAREFQRLAFHTTLNDLKNVRCLKIAASDQSGDAMLKIAWDWNSGHNTFGEFFNPTVEMTGEERVQTQPLDALVAAQSLERVDLIKIDVEGHELRVLAGAVQTLKRFRPRVLVEVFGATLQRQAASVELVYAFFESHGYELLEFSPISGDLVPLAQSASDQSRNLVALPR